MRGLITLGVLCALGLFAIATTTAQTERDYYKCATAEAVNAFLREAASDDDVKLGARGALPRSRVPGSLRIPLAMTAVAKAPCLVLNGGWWQYEFCMDRWVRQFHAENGHIQSEFLLGVHPNAIDPNDEIANRPIQYVDGIYGLRRKLSAIKSLRTDGRYYCSRDMDKRMKGFRAAAAAKPSSPVAFEDIAADASDYHAVVSTYSDGSFCDETARPRETRVVLTCDGAGHIPIGFNITEVDKCQYLLFVHGSASCDVVRRNRHSAQPDAVYGAVPSSKVDRGSGSGSGAQSSQRQQQREAESSRRGATRDQATSEELQKREKQRRGAAAVEKTDNDDDPSPRPDPESDSLKPTRHEAADAATKEEQTQKEPTERKESDDLVDETATPKVAAKLLQRLREEQQQQPPQESKDDSLFGGGAGSEAFPGSLLFSL